MAPTVPELNAWTNVAQELRRIASAVDTLPAPAAKPFISLSILPDKTVEAVNTVAMAVLGKVGALESTGGVHRQKAESNVFGRVYISIHAQVPGPQDDRDVELEKLRAEVAELRGLAYTRVDDEPDDPTPVSPARVPLHTGAMTDRGLVDETDKRAR